MLLQGISNFLSHTSTNATTIFRHAYIYEPIECAIHLRKSLHFSHQYCLVIIDVERQNDITFSCPLQVLIKELLLLEKLHCCYDTTSCIIGYHVTHYVM